MEKIAAVLLFGMLVTFGCTDSDQVHPGGRQGEFCDANDPCPEGYDCYKFPDEENPICWDPSFDPCSVCPSGKCVIAESYPMQVFCTQ